MTHEHAPINPAVTLGDTISSFSTTLLGASFEEMQGIVAKLAQGQESPEDYAWSTQVGMILPVLARIALNDVEEGSFQISTEQARDITESLPFQSMLERFDTILREARGPNYNYLSMLAHMVLMGLCSEDIETFYKNHHYFQPRIST